MKIIKYKNNKLKVDKNNFNTLFIFILKRMIHSKMIHSQKNEYIEYEFQNKSNKNES